MIGSVYRNLLARPLGLSGFTNPGPTRFVTPVKLRDPGFDLHTVVQRTCHGADRREGLVRRALS